MPVSPPPPQVRKLVLEMVLSTDMDVHFTLLKRFQDQLGLLPDVREWATPELRSLLFQVRVCVCGRDVYVC